MKIPSSFMAAALLVASGMKDSIRTYIDHDRHAEPHSPGQFKDYTPMRRFVVNGIAIKARSKKLAEKIYRLHHSETANNE
jgi:hypothetical protein